MTEKAKHKIRALIVDDEPLARQNIRILLQADPEVEIIGECGSAAAAIKAIREKTPDLVFLDIQMPKMSGFDILKQLDTNQIPIIIFVTAYDEYALKAFEAQALDYLLKPFDDSRFEMAVQRAKSQIAQRQASELSHKLRAVLMDEDQFYADEPSDGSYLTQLMIKTSSRVFFLNVEEIDWIEAADYYVQLHFKGKSHLLRETMNELVAKLNPKKFMRIHRSAIINLDRVKLVQPRASEYVVILSDNTEIKLSRRR